MKKFALILSAIAASALALGAAAAEPVLTVDFANGAGDLELVESEIVEDATRGKVLQVSGMGAGTTGQSYALLNTDLFEKTNWDDGMTVSMWVKTDVGSTTLKGTAPIFSLDIANVGYIGLTTSLESAINTDGNDTSLGIAPRIWTDPANISGGVNKTEEGVWQLITVVYGEENISLYVDGELVSDRPFANGNAGDLTGMVNLMIQMEYVYSLRLGSWLCSWWNYGDYEGMIDDVNIYNLALSADDISDLYNDTKIAQTSFEKAPDLSELYDGTLPAPVYALDFTDASSVELVGAEITQAERGAALKVNGTGDGTNGTSYGLVTTDMFKNTDWSNGMTVSMWVKPDASETLKGNAPLYSLDIAEIGYIAVVASLESGINSDGNNTELGIAPRMWNDPSNVGGSVSALKAGEWQQVTVVYGEQDMAIYLNGEVMSKPVVNGGAMSDLFTQIGTYVPSLRLGSWLCDWWKQGDFEGLIDDVQIFNTALNPLQAKNLFTGEGQPAEAAPAETVEAPAEAIAPAEEVAEAPVEAPAPAEEVIVPAAAGVETAPKTFDAAVIAAIAVLGSAAGAGYVFKKKR